jgi:hypothetical protein
VPPRAFKHSPSEAAAEPTDSRKSNASDLDRFTVEHVHTCVIENLGNQPGLTRFIIVIADNG